VKENINFYIYVLIILLKEMMIGLISQICV